MPSSLWSQLPSEIQHKIFQKVDSRDLIQLQTTCKSWHSAAREYFYGSRITLSAHGGEREKLLKQTLQTPGNPLRLLVKVLSINQETGQGDTQEDFDTLLAFGALCPNLTVILTAVPSKEYYETLLALRQVGHLKNLSRIEAPCPSDFEYFSTVPSASDIEDYSAVARAFKTSLREFCLFQNVDASVTENDSIAASFSMAQNLKQFTQLKDLHITISNNFDLHRIDELLEACTDNLEKICITFTQASEPSELPSARQFNPKSSARLYNIKALELQDKGPLTDQDLIYMMHRFPALQKISLLKGPVPTPDTSSGPSSADLICKYVQYLESIPQVTLRDFKVAPDIMCTLITDLSKHWKVDKLELGASPEWREDPFAYLSVIRHPFSAKNPSASFAIKLELPSDEINPLYDFALRAFSGQLTKVGVWGDLAEDEGFLGMHTDTQRTKFAIYNESLGHIFNSTTKIKDVLLQALLIDKLPASITSSAEEMQLDSLEINTCAIYPTILNQLSHQRLSFVKRLTLNSTAIISSDPSSGVFQHEETDIYMPYTAFDKIHVKYLGFVILLTLSTDAMIRYYACTGPELLEQVSKEDYREMKTTAEGVPSINIICRDCNVVTVSGRMGFGGNEVILH